MTEGRDRRMNLGAKTAAILAISAFGIMLAGCGNNSFQNNTVTVNDEAGAGSENSSEENDFVGMWYENRDGQWEPYWEILNDGTITAYAPEYLDPYDMNDPNITWQQYDENIIVVTMSPKERPDTKNNFLATIKQGALKIYINPEDYGYTNEEARELSSSVGGYLLPAEDALNEAESPYDPLLIKLNK